MYFVAADHQTLYVQISLQSEPQQHPQCHPVSTCLQRGYITKPRSNDERLFQQTASMHTIACSSYIQCPKEDDRKHVTRYFSQEVC